MKYISGTRKNVGNPENVICDASCGSPSNGLRRFIGTAENLIRKIPVSMSPVAVEIGVRKKLSGLMKENKLIVANKYTISFTEDNRFYVQNQYIYIYIYIYIYKSTISMPPTYFDNYIVIIRECKTLSYSKNFQLSLQLTFKNLASYI